MLKARYGAPYFSFLLVCSFFLCEINFMCVVHKMAVSVRDRSKSMGYPSWDHRQGTKTFFQLGVKNIFWKKKEIRGPKIFQKI